MNSSVDLTSLALNAIAGASNTLCPSELHGSVIGIAACDVEAFSLQKLVDLLGVEALRGEEDVELFVRESLNGFLDVDMAFTPLLPDDDESLEGRLEALGEWTSGFLAGLVEGLHPQVQSMDVLPEEVQEIIRDFAAIADVGLDIQDNEAEKDYMQLEEFVKVGALLIMSMLNDAADDSSQ